MMGVLAALVQIVVTAVCLPITGYVWAFAIIFFGYGDEKLSFFGKSIVNFTGALASAAIGLWSVHFLLKNYLGNSHRIALKTAAIAVFLFCILFGVYFIVQELSPIHVLSLVVQNAAIGVGLWIASEVG